MKVDTISTRIGILGGGQLGRMLIQEAINLDIHISVLDPDPNCPCKDIAHSFKCGSFNDKKTVIEFAQNCDLLTIEIEHVNIEALEEIEQNGKSVFPQPSILRMIQDKGLQKKFYRENNIPTPDFVLVNSKKELGEHAGFLPFMQKLRKGGYDGKGVYPVRSVNEIESAFDSPSVLEKFVDLDKEISVIVARNSAGDIAHFPPVELQFNPEANLVEFLFSPSSINKSIEEKAISIARSIAQKTGIVGILAVEMFIDKKGEVLVNEIAPRPHNSGHQSIEGNITSQYEQHLRAILNFPLGSTQIIQPSVMVNILGETGHEGNVIYSGFEEVLKMDSVYVHLYGKKKTKPFRKMGHVTILADTVDQAKQKAMMVKQILKALT